MTVRNHREDGLSPRIRVIGIGSPFGDDRLGWMAAEALQNSPALAAISPRIAISMLDRPGAMLLARWRGADNVILIDAVRSGAAPGVLHRWLPDDLPARRAPTSSHGFGIASALELARALGLLPPRLVLHGMEIDPDRSEGGLSAAVLQSMPALIGAVEQDALALARL